MNLLRQRPKLSACIEGISAASACLVIMLLIGCATTAPAPRTCAMILIVDGKHTHPSVRQYAAVERKMGDAFARRGMQLVSEITSAALIATIECRVNLGAPETMDLVVRDVSPNTFRHRDDVLPPSIKDLPSLRAAEFEHERAKSGVSRPGID